MREETDYKGRPASIVSVDDEMYVQKVVERLVRRMGHTVTLCGNGAEALRAVTPDTDLVLLDMMMPGMDGLSVLSRIKDNPETADVPVVMVTALSERDIRLRALEGGAADFLTKPVDLVELQARITSHVQARRAHREVLRYQTELEQLVDARTRKLADANQKLHNEVADRIKVEMELRANQESLRTLTTELAMVEDKERRNIAADLHDRVCQSLAIAQIRMEQLASKLKPENREPMAQVVSLVEGAITDLRTLMYEISPQSLYELGLRHALEELADQFDAEYGMEVSFAMEGDPGDVEPDVRGLVYRAVRELMINAIKHSGGANLRVVMKDVDGDMHILVEDDGRGFHAEAQARETGSGRSFGLMSLRERLLGVGGRVEVASEPGKGTRGLLVMNMQS